MKSAKQYRQELKKNGVFYTDPKLALKLKSFFPPNIKEIYDPTSGSGNLLNCFNKDVRKYGQEIDEETAIEANNRITNTDIRAGDTLMEDKFEGVKFKWIIANPPFSVKWQPEKLKDDIRFIGKPLPPPSKADYAFIYHILHHLDNDGFAIVLNAPGILSRGNKEQKCRQYLIDNNYIDSVISVPSGYFEDTKISTALLKIKKNRGDKQPIHFEDWGQNINKEVEIKDIINNNYDLSVNRYIQPKPTIIENDKPLPTLEEITKDISDKTIESVRQFFELAMKIPQMLSMNNLLDRVQNIVDEYRNKII